MQIFVAKKMHQLYSIRTKKIKRCDCLKKKIVAGVCAAVALSLALVLGGCKKSEEPTLPPIDPHEGMVEVSSGMGTLMWVPFFENVKLNEFEAEDFYKADEFIEFSGEGYYTRRGIDVSEHQHEIDWRAVAQAGIDFAMIRAGYRGYSAGGLFEDAYFRQNMEGALANGIDVGVYFFSQAVTTEEAREEAQFLLELISDYDISLSVVFDWEQIGTVPARTDGVSGAQLTDFAIAFCDVIEDAGYNPMIYLYRYIGYFLYEMGRLADYDLWVGAIGSYPDFYYKHQIWQYSITGSIPGIEGDVDLNIMFVRAPAHEGYPKPPILN